MKKTTWLVIAGALLAGCAEQKQETTVWPSARPAPAGVTPAAASAWLEAHPDVLPAADRGRYRPAVVLATSRDKDSWQARLLTPTGVEAVVDDLCTDPSVADVAIVPGDVVRWYPRADGTVTVAGRDDSGVSCDHLATMRVLVPAAVGVP